MHYTMTIDDYFLMIYFVIGTLAFLGIMYGLGLLVASGKDE